MRVDLRRNGHSAFTLAELMLSFVVLSVLSVVLLGIVPSTIIGLHAASQRANAALVAESQLEELRRAGFGSLAATEPPYPTRQVDQTLYSYRVELTPARLSSGELMESELAQQVQVTVEWTSKTGPQSYTACAVMFRRL